MEIRRRNNIIAPWITFGLTGAFAIGAFFGSKSPAEKMEASQELHPLGTITAQESSGIGLGDMVKSLLINKVLTKGFDPESIDTIYWSDIVARQINSVNGSKVTIHGGDSLSVSQVGENSTEYKFTLVDDGKIITTTFDFDKLPKQR